MAPFEWQGVVELHVEDFFLVRVADHVVDTSGFEDADSATIRDHRWWFIPEKAGSGEVFAPADLAALLADLLRGADATSRAVSTRRFPTRAARPRTGVVAHERRAVAQVPVQRRPGDAGLCGDLTECFSLVAQEPGVFDCVGGVGDRPADVAAMSSRDCPGVGVAFRAESALYLGEQREQAVRCKGCA